MYIPKRYWAYVESIAAAHDVDPVQLFETAAWQMVERAIDVFAAQDEGNVDVAVDPALADMLAENGPLLAVFAHALWPRAAKAIRGDAVVSQVTADDRDAAGRFKAIAARPNATVDAMPGAPWQT